MEKSSNYRLITQGVIVLILVLGIYKAFTLPQSAEPAELGTADRITGLSSDEKIVEVPSGATDKPAGIEDIPTGNVVKEPTCNVCNNIRNDYEVHIFMVDNRICSDSKCTCESTLCDLDWSLTELKVHLDYENQEDNEQDGLRLHKSCQGDGKEIEVTGGLLMLGNHQNIAFPTNRAYISTILPGGFFEYAYSIDIYHILKEDPNVELTCNFNIQDADGHYLMNQDLYLKMNLI